MHDNCVEGRRPDGRVPETIPAPQRLTLFSEDFVDALAEAVAKKVMLIFQQSNSPQRLLTVQETAVYLGRSVKAVDHMLARGIIQVTKLDGKRQVDRVTLNKLIEDRTYYEAA